MMRSGSLVWGLIIIVVGIMLLLGNLGLLPVNAWQLVWPVVLIVLGLSFLFGPRLYGTRAETRQVSIPIVNSRAEIRLNHGAGRLEVSGTAPAGQLLSGTFEGGVEFDTQRSGEADRVQLNAPVGAYFPGFWMGSSRGYSWQIEFSPDIDLNMIFKTGASESRLDLSSLRVRDLRIETGASSTELILPQNAGNTRAEIHAGAASVDIRLPEGVSGHIRVQSGLSGIKIDTIRFTMIGNNEYQSPDFQTAANRADIYIEAGVGSISVR
jgi:hypothetical protein